MKLLLIFTLVVSFSGLAQFKEKEFDSEIKEVTVFTSAAQVHRTAAVQVSKGYNRIKLTNLSPFINENSIQIQGFKDVLIVSVNHYVDFLAESTLDPEFKVLLKERDALLFEREKLRIKKVNLIEEKKLLYANKKLGSENAGVNIDDILDMSEFYQSRISDINQLERKYTRSEYELTEKINALNKQLKERRDKLNTSRGVIEVTVKAEKQSQGILEFNYVVRNAGWYPTYDVRSKGLQKPLDFTYKAKVYQLTGNDWKNVEVRLSTGNFDKSSTAPELYPWRLRRAYNNKNTYSWDQGGRSVQAPKKKAFEQEPYQSQQIKEDKLFADTSYSIQNQLQLTTINTEGNRHYYTDAPSTSVIVQKEVYSAPLIDRNSNTSADITTVSETSVNTVFEIDIPYSIPSNGEEYTVDIQANTIPAVYQYYCAPRQDRDAFLVAKSADWDALNILPGNSSVYFQNTFVGEAFINPVVTLDTLEFSLGRDKNLVIERELLKDYSKSAVVGSKKKVTRGYTIKVRNTRQEAISIEIVDQIPVSSQKEIEISLLESTGAKYNKETGKLTWNLKIEPGTTKELQYKFELKAPKDYRVTGI